MVTDGRWRHQPALDGVRALAVSLYAEDTPQRVDAWNRLLARDAVANPVRPTLLDLNRVICPGGAFTWSIGGARVRSDGLHFTPTGVQRVIAPWLLPQLDRPAGTA